MFVDAIWMARTCKVLQRETAHANRTPFYLPLMNRADGTTFLLAFRKAKKKAETILEKSRMQALHHLEKALLGLFMPFLLVPIICRANWSQARKAFEKKVGHWPTFFQLELVCAATDM